MPNRKEHNQPGHLSTYVLDQDSYHTGYGKHNRVIVYCDGSGAREDFRHNLPPATEADIRRVAKHEGVKLLELLEVTACKCPTYQGWSRHYDFRTENLRRKAKWNAR